MYDQVAERMPQLKLESSPNQIDVGNQTKANERHLNHNEDNSFFNPNGSLGVFDGMGGEANGELSSKFCCELVKARMNQRISANMPLAEAKQQLEEIALWAQQSFMECKNNHKLGKLGGSTGTFGFIRHTETGGSQLVVANLGDSRAYLYRPGSDIPLKQLTVDDSVVEYRRQQNKTQPKSFFDEIQKKIDEVDKPGQLNQTEQLFFDQKNQIFNHFGSEEKLEPRIYTQDLQEGDILLFSTDGIHDNLTSSEIGRILSQHRNSPGVANNLVNEALNRSRDLNHLRHKPDDMTAMVIKFSAPEIPQATTSKIAKTLILPDESNYNHNNLVNISPKPGLVEGGWSVVDSNSYPGNVVVAKPGPNGEELRYLVPISEVSRYNRPRRIEDISTATNLTELTHILIGLGGLQGASEFLSSDYLVDKIYQYLSGDPAAKLDAITRTAGLRDKVKSFASNPAILEELKLMA